MFQSWYKEPLLIASRVNAPHHHIYRRGLTAYLGHMLHTVMVKGTLIICRSNVPISKRDIYHIYQMFHYHGNKSPNIITRSICHSKGDINLLYRLLDHLWWFWYICSTCKQFIEYKISALNIVCTCCFQNLVPLITSTCKMYFFE